MGRMLVLLIIFTAAGAPLGALAQAPELTRDEIMRVLWHGPWPPARASHPERAAIALGERLFFDPRISGNGSVLCASCHVPYRGFQDGRPRAFGLEEGERNTPSLFNVGFYRRYGWDGARASLAAQSLRPLLEKKEMNSSAAHVASLVRKLYAADYRSAFARAPDGDDEKLFADAGTALAAFQQTLVSARTPFDDFRDALERGDERAVSSYSATARRGLKLFIAQCSTCHAAACATRRPP